MNSPMKESNLKGKELCVCYFVQKVMELEGNKSKKELDDIANGQSPVTDLEQPAIDATAKSVTITLDDNLEMTRTEGQTTVKAGKLSQEKQTAKKIQDINNKHKREASKDDKDDQSR